MVQDAYIAVVECNECHSRFLVKYLYPSKQVEPFGDWCGCPDITMTMAPGALTPDEWFAEMDAKKQNLATA